MLEMPATPAIPAMTAVVRLVLFITKLLSVTGLMFCRPAHSYPCLSTRSPDESKQQRFKLTIFRYSTQLPANTDLLQFADRQETGESGAARGNSTTICTFRPSWLPNQTTKVGRRRP